MKAGLRLLLLMSLLLGGAGPGQAIEDFKTVTLQNAAGATGNGTAIDVASYTSVALSVTISNTATVTFEGTADGTTWASRSCVSIASTSGTGVTTATATGTYQCNVAGLSQFRARVSAWTSGTVTVVARATTAVARVGGGGLPDVGNESDCLMVSSGAWASSACPGASGGDSVSVDGAAVVDPNFDSGGDIDFVNTSNTITANVKANSVALGTDTTGNYAAGDAEGGAATSGDSATNFFSTGTIEDARLPSSMADKAITGSLNIPNGAAPTTDAFGEIAADNNAWAASRGAIQFYDGTGNTYIVGVLASDTPSNGECVKWNTGGTITWETCGSGSMATDTLWDAAGDLAVGTGSNTGGRLAMGTANQLLRVNAGATALEWATVSGTGDVTAASTFGTDNVIVRSDGTSKGVQSTGVSIDDSNNMSGAASVQFGSDPGDAGRIRLSNNESLCWEAATPGTDLCLTLNSSNEFTMNAPLNLTGTAGATLLTGVTSPSAPGTAEQWYFYADSADDLPKYIYNGGSEQTFYTTANPQTTATTPSANDNDTSIATTAYVQTELTNYAADSKTLTNTTLDCEGTGNACTITKKVWLPAAGCNNATAGSVWDLPTSSPAVAACVTGTNTQKGVLDFADGSNLSAQITYLLSSEWTGAIDAKFKWLTTATSGDVVWQLATICVADAETDDPAFNTASTVTDTAKGTTNQTNDASITGVTATGCAAGELLHLKVSRDSGHASDSLAATARLIGVELTLREAK